MFFDTHCHYDDKRFNQDRDEILASLEKNGVSKICNVGACLNSSKDSIAIASAYSFASAACGVHPHEVKNLKNGDLNLLGDMLTSPCVVALGEIGLDYYYDHSPRPIQKKWFVKQYELARDLNMPVIVHCRDAYKDTMDILKAHKEVDGVMHCFSGSIEIMREVLRLGMYISIAGPVTYKNAQTLVQAAKEVPEDRLLIETDCPYLSPVPHRGKRNYSVYLTHTAETIANIRGISIGHLAQITTENAKRFYRL